MRAMPLAFPGQRAHARLRDAVHVRRRAAGRADHRARRRGRCRAAARRLVRPRDATAHRGPPGDSLSRDARSLSGVRARRLRAAAGTGRAAHRRNRSRRGRSTRSTCSASRRRRSTASRRPRSRSPRDSHGHRDAGVKVEMFGDAAGIRVERRAAASMSAAGPPQARIAPLGAAQRRQPQRGSAP